MASLRSTPTRFLLLAAAPAVLGACTMVGAVEPVRQPAPTGVERGGVAPAPDSRRDTEAEGATDRVGERVVQVALEYLGTPYEWGGTDANGFDCSGLIQFAYARFGIQLPRVSSDQLRQGWGVDPTFGALRPGDILGFSARPGGKTTHVGLYVGGGDFIHSSSSGVRISTLSNRYWREHLVAARRVAE